MEGVSKGLARAISHVQVKRKKIEIKMHYLSDGLAMFIYRLCKQFLIDYKKNIKNFIKI